MEEKEKWNPKAVEKYKWNNRIYFPKEPNSQSTASKPKMINTNTTKGRLSLHKRKKKMIWKKFKC